MKIIKGVITYIGVLALIAIALCMIAAGYLFLFPENDLFGITYIQFNGRDSASIENASDVTALSITTQDFDVEICIGDDDSTSIFSVYSARFTGFGLKDSKEITISATKESGRATIMLAEPVGLYSRNDCFLQVFIPNSVYSNGFDLTVNTNGADIVIGEEYDNSSTKYLRINDLSVKTKTGDININSVNFVNTTSDNTNDVYCDIGDGKINFNEHFLGTINKANIITNNGKASFIENPTATIEKVIWSNKASGRLHADKLSILEGNTSGGVLNIDEVDTINLFGKDTRVIVGTINNTSSINLSSSGNVTVGHAKEYIEINNVKGNVSVKKADEAISVFTKSGDISIKNATKYISAESSSGDISLAFKEDIDSYSDAVKLRFVQVVTKTGDVIVNGVDYILANTKEKGSAKFQIFFHDLANSKLSKINSNGGKVKVITPYFSETEPDVLRPKPFIVKTKTTGSVDLRIHSKNLQTPGEHLTCLHGAVADGAGACETKIEIDAKNGSIYVRDARFYEANI